MISWLKEFFRREPKVWFTSDLHFGHKQIIIYCQRSYSNVEKMNKAIFKTWNKTVKKQDTVYCLGDFSLNPRYSKELVPKLKGKKILVAGNHDRCHISDKRNGRYAKEYLKHGWETVYTWHTNFKLKDGTDVLLSHLPYKPKSDETFDARYMNLRPDDEGKVLLCGHLHGKFIKYNRMIDVGWDAQNGKFLSEDDIIAIIKDKRDFIPSHLTGFQIEKNKIKVSGNNAD